MLPIAPPLPDFFGEKVVQHTAYQNLKKNDPEYGRPPKGSRTEQRGLAAQAHIQQEVKYLCEIIENMGRKQENSTYVITFKELFDFYTNISNKLVGILLRARKHGYIHFSDEYEALFQGKHDQVQITLVQQPSDS